MLGGVNKKLLMKKSSLNGLKWRENWPDHLFDTKIPINWWILFRQKIDRKQMVGGRAAIKTAISLHREIGETAEVEFVTRVTYS